MKTSLASKRQLSPTPGHRLRQKHAAETLNHCSISSCHPRLHLQDLVAGCRLSRLPLIAYSPSHGPSLEPATVSFTPSCFLDLFLVICWSLPQPVQEGESRQSAMKSWLSCKNVLKHNLMHGSGKHGHPDVMSDVDRVIFLKQPAMFLLSQGALSPQPKHDSQNSLKWLLVLSTFFDLWESFSTSAYLSNF